MELRGILGGLHLTAGVLALVAFWFPLFLKKGAKAHRTFGWIFVGAMAFILVSAATMTVMRLISGDDTNIALFLGFLTLITFAAVWGGIMVLRHKTDPAWLRGASNLSLSIVIAVAAGALLWQWWESRFALFLVFAIIGLVTTVPELLRWRRPVTVEPRFWMMMHLENMIIAGMAAHIAFFAFGASRLWPELYSSYPWWVMLIPWVAPFPIAFTAIALIQRHYRRKFSGA